MPTINKNRDHGELQDMYRRALAASWQSHGAELPADQCVEDIFNGGDGWKEKRNSRGFTTHHSDEDNLSDERPRIHLHPVSQHYRSHSGSSVKSQNTITDKGGVRPGQRSPGYRDGSGRNNAENDTSSENSSGKRRMIKRAEYEVDEFEALENLVAWRLPSSVS